MDFRHPRTDKDFRDRHQLLQTSLRSNDVPFPIEEEYPIMLGEKDTGFSYCLYHDNELVAHAHMWPRTLIDQEKKPIARVGLVGNVATSPQHRGKGYSHILLQKLEERARQQELKALILWSDLHQFYQNLGFTSVGEELRFHFHLKALMKVCPDEGLFAVRDFAKLQERDLAELLNHRFQVPYTLERSLEEYQKLLKIPAMALFTNRSNNTFAYVGKGCDMGCVVHEWGAKDPQALMTVLKDICIRFNFAEIVLLAPLNLPTPWLERFAQNALQYEKHPMALGKILEPGVKDLQFTLQKSFIWGLDSV